MAGIYIHIPFCKQACHYCNFHFSTQLNYRQQMVDALIKELHLRKSYLQNATIESIYIGGGTPSLLTAQQLQQLFDAIYQLHNVSPLAEITLEANPDDLDNATILALKRTPVNRLSIGVQSFFDEELKWMNRAHSAQQAFTAIQECQNAGLSNITIDLIYGSPTLTDEKWLRNLNQAIELKLNHISSYCLTVEEGTALHHFIQSHKMEDLNEDKASTQFNMLVDTLTANGFEQYEISNFARQKSYAVHNTNYWKQKAYLGIGPSAHSYNFNTRSWNVSNNQQYIKNIEHNRLNSTQETLTKYNQMNEFIMTGLRTIWGIDMLQFEMLFGKQYALELKTKLEKSIAVNQIEQFENHFKLTRQARFFADGIAASLFID